MGGLLDGMDDLIGNLIGAERQQHEMLMGVWIPFVCDISMILAVTTRMTMGWQDGESW